MPGKRCQSETTLGGGEVSRLKELRESRKLSQGDIEKRTGLLRCYISRVENGHTVPAVETLEKLARALEVPMHQLFHDGEAASSIRNLKLPKGGLSRLPLQTTQATCQIGP
jgi:transcriptional regulator with XRE-family HTH domain